MMTGQRKTKLRLAAVLCGLAAPMLAFAPAHAQNGYYHEAAFENLAYEFVMDRLEEPRGAQIEILSDPYPVYANLGRYGQTEAWAIDVSVRARLRTHRYGGDMDYTIVFVDGEPIAFASELRGGIEDRDRRYARDF